MMTVNDIGSCLAAIEARIEARVVLVAGASCSGKTVLSRELARQFVARGCPALHLTLDDYYVGAARNPRDENGDFDFETPDALDAERVVADVGGLLAGRAVHLHRYDFATHAIHDDPEPTTLAPGARIVIEGIHAFNPKMTASLPEAVKCRVFVDPTSVAEGIGPDELRLLRRIVRDERLRAIAPEETFRMWPKVQSGERRWLLPFRSAADFVYDSAFPGELERLLPVVRPLLEQACRERPDDRIAIALLATATKRVAPDV